MVLHLVGFVSVPKVVRSNQSGSSLARQGLMPLGFARRLSVASLKTFWDFSLVTVCRNWVNCVELSCTALVKDLKSTSASKTVSFWVCDRVQVALDEQGESPSDIGEGGWHTRRLLRGQRGNHVGDGRTESAELGMQLVQVIECFLELLLVGLWRLRLLCRCLRLGSHFVWRIRRMARAEVPKGYKREMPLEKG